MGKKILSLDFSLGGSSLFYNENNDLRNYKFVYFSDKKSDIKQSNCIEVKKEYTSDEKLDNVISEFIRLVKDKDLFIMESPSYNSVNANDSFKYGYGIILYITRRLNIPTLLVTPISLKLYLTGDGKATKEDMCNYIEKYEHIYYKKISKSKWDNICDAHALYELGVDYLKCNTLPAKKGCVDTSDIKYYDTLPLHRKMVISKLYNRDDLYQEAKKQRDKIKKEEKKGK